MRLHERTAPSLPADSPPSLVDLPSRPRIHTLHPFADPVCGGAGAGEGLPGRPALPPLPGGGAAGPPR
eukprot:3149057-Pyramimonas_sp.AAC.1